MASTARRLSFGIAGGSGGFPLQKYRSYLTDAQVSTNYSRLADAPEHDTCAVDKLQASFELLCRQYVEARTQELFLQSLIARTTEISPEDAENRKSQYLASVEAKDAVSSKVERETKIVEQNHLPALADLVTVTQRTKKRITEELQDISNSARSMGVDGESSGEIEAANRAASASTRAAQTADHFGDVLNTIGLVSGCKVGDVHAARDSTLVVPIHVSSISQNKSVEHCIYIRLDPQCNHKIQEVRVSGGSVRYSDIASSLVSSINAFPNPALHLHVLVRELVNRIRNTIGKVDELCALSTRYRVEVTQDEPIILVDVGGSQRRVVVEFLVHDEYPATCPPIKVIDVHGGIGNMTDQLNEYIGGAGPGVTVTQVSDFAANALAVVQ